MWGARDVYLCFGESDGKYDRRLWRTDGKRPDCQANAEYKSILGLGSSKYLVTYWKTFTNYLSNFAIAWYFN